MNINWTEAGASLPDLTDEERRIVEMLAQGKTQPQIGEALQQHRSMVWRKVQKLRKRLRTEGEPS